MESVPQPMCQWPLVNGENLTFFVHPFDAQWEALPGLYIFAALEAHGWAALYVGQTEDFSATFPNDEMRSAAHSRGANAIHALVVPRAAERDRLKRLLVEDYRPPLNTESG